MDASHHIPQQNGSRFDREAAVAAAILDGRKDTGGGPCTVDDRRPPAARVCAASLLASFMLRFHCCRSLRRQAH